MSSKSSQKAIESDHSLLAIDLVQIALSSECGPPMRSRPPIRSCNREPCRIGHWLRESTGPDLTQPNEPC